MNKQLEKQLIDKYPTFFVDMYGDPRNTCMAFGCDVGDGWYGLLDRLCQEIKAEVDDDHACKDFKFTQIKEMYGQLRVYSWYGNSEIEDAISRIHTASAYVCEACGTSLDVQLKGGWIKALCGACRSKK